MVIGTALMGFLLWRFGMETTQTFASNLFTAVMIDFAMRKFFISTNEKNRRRRRRTVIDDDTSAN